MLSIENIGTIDGIQANRSKSRWFLLKLNNLKQYAVEKAKKLEKKLFTHSVVKGFLEQANFSFLEMLFGTVTPEIFESNIDLIVENWKSWPQKTGYYGFKIVEEIDKSKALELAQEHLESPEGLSDFEKSAAVTQFISSESIQGVDAVAGQFLERVGQVPNPFLKEIYERIAFTVALSRGTSQGHGVFERLLKDGIEKENLGNILGDIYYYGTGGLSFYMGLRDKQLDTRLFSRLSPLFAAGVPLDHFDSAQGLLGDDLYKKSVELWDSLRFPFKFPLSDILNEERSSWRKIIGRSKFKREFGLFLTAVMIRCWLVEQPALSSLSTPQLVELAFVPFDEVPWYEALHKELEQRDKGEVIEVLQGAVAAHGAATECVIPVRLMGALRYAEFAPGLLALLTEKTGNELSYAIGEALVFLGEGVIPRIDEVWEQGDLKLQLYTLEVMSRLSSPSLYDYLVKGWARMSDVQLKIWCQAAKNSGDERILTFLEETMTKTPSYMEIGILRDTYSGLAETLELQTPFMERIESFERSMRAEGGMHGEGLELELRCPVCGEMSDYRVSTLVVTMGFHLDHPLVGGDLRCNFCGARPQFQITQSGFGKYIEEFGRVSTLMAANKEFESAIQFVEPFLVKGSQLSIPQALKYFQEKVKENPSSPRHQLYLGHIFQKARAMSSAIGHFKQTIYLDPTNIEAPFFLAMVLEELGRSKEALEVLLTVKFNLNRYSYYIFKKRDRKELGESIAGLHNYIKRKLGLREVEDLPEDFLLHQKIGANDRCPCGSAKKFKKCCMKKNIY